jgi:hypothetical protein
MEPVMGNYRAYILGINGRRFIWVESFSSDHPDDVAALNAAKELSDKHDVEVWDGSRLVARLSPGGEVMSPELVPSLVSLTPRDSDKKTVDPISLSRVSELASGDSRQGSLFLS